MAKHCDVISPMIYPSHFFGMDGYAAPGDAPEHFISVSMDRFEKVTAGTGVVLRPWLQAFHWRTKTYSPEYILKQVSSSHAHHGDGFLFWNAANDYSKPFAAMPTMMANPKTYLYTPPTAVAQSSSGCCSPGKDGPNAGCDAATTVESLPRQTFVIDALRIQPYVMLAGEISVRYNVLFA